MSDSALPPSLPPQNMPTIPGARDDLKWPKVLGILTIIFGVLGILTSLSSFLTGKMLKGQMKLISLAQEMSEEAWQAFDAFIAKWNWYYMTSGGIFLMANLFLLLGGIACLTWKKKSRLLFTFYAVMAAAYAGFSAWAIFGTTMMEEQLLVMTPEGTPPQGPELMFSQVIAVITVALYLILPIFLVIWFMLKKISTDVQTRFS